MSVCCCCVGSAPPRGGGGSKRQSMYDKYQDYSNKWDVTMCDAPCAEPCCCCYGCLPCTFLCANWQMRKRVLNAQSPGSGLKNYICVQGYVPKCCCGLWNPGHMGETHCPATCLCCEACCCPGMVITASRLLAMDMYAIQPDPCDNRLIRFNNCLQLLACICHILALCNDAFRDLACIIDCIADCVFLSTAGCMMGQLHRELDVRKKSQQGGGPVAPDLPGLDVIVVAPPKANTINERGDGNPPTFEDVDLEELYEPRTVEV
mmetsp:Transcript_29485/g.95057  ORF Transcript_29485/g.95057 Transcript_29485/m.95057 type:complete len:262 (-) Transcript_29485:857-1642(-)